MSAVAPSGAGTPVSIDVLVVSVAGTLGWQNGARSLAGAFVRAGARTVHVEAGPVPEVRTFALTDLVQASAARKAALLALAQHRPEAVVYCSVTAALLAPRPGAIWLDATAHENRPGRHGVWQRPVEARRLRRAPLLLLWSSAALGGLGDRVCDHADAVVVPPVVDPSGPTGGPRDLAAVTYAADPVKRRLEVVLDAWEAVRTPGEELVVAGLQRPDRPGVRFAGRLPAAEWRGLLRRARVLLAAPRREDYGIAALEALADGAMLATTPAAGPYLALGLARALDPRLVGDDLGAAIRVALDHPRPGYAARARELVAPFSAAGVSAVLGADVLPRLLPGWAG